MVVFPEFTFADRFFSDTFLLECLVSACFPNQNRFDHVVANFLSAVSCSEELI
jgi:hypothetical protein